MADPKFSLDIDADSKDPSSPTVTAGVEVDSDIAQANATLSKTQDGVQANVAGSVNLKALTDLPITVEANATLSPNGSLATSETVAVALSENANVSVEADQSSSGSNVNVGFKITF